jgi:hypothetical protein
VLTAAPEARPGLPPRRQPGAGERRAPRERSPARPPPPARSRRGPRGRRRRARGLLPLAGLRLIEGLDAHHVGAASVSSHGTRIVEHFRVLSGLRAKSGDLCASRARIATRGWASRVVTKGQKSRKVFVSDRQIVRPLTTNSRSHNTRGSTHSSQSTQPAIGLLESERTVSHG